MPLPLATLLPNGWDLTPLAIMETNSMVGMRYNFCLRVATYISRQEGQIFWQILCCC